MNPFIKDFLTIGISCVSLLLSGYAIWVAQFNRGRLKMTRPTLLCLKRELPSGIPKIFLRTCLFTTGSKGQVIESMFLRVRHSYGEFTFDFWGHTESGKLTLGSGLYVGPAGIASDHHFNPRQNASIDFLYVSGEYEIDVFATIVGKKKPKRLHHAIFSVDGNQSAELVQIPTRAMFLVWNADTQSYDGQVRHENRTTDSDKAYEGIDRQEVFPALFMDALLNHVPNEETE